MLSTVNFVKLKYLIIIYPILLLTGPFFSDLFLVLISVLYILYITKNKSWANFFNKKYNRIFLILYIILVLSSLFSDYLLYSLKTSVLYIRYVFFFNAIMLIYEKDKNLFQRFCQINFFTLMFVSFDTIFQYNFGYNIIGLVSSNNVRMGSFFGDELIVGSYLSRLFPYLIIYLFFFIKDEKYQFFKIIPLIFVGIAIFFSGERTSFLFFLISSLSIFIIFKNKKLLMISSLIFLVILTYSTIKNVKLMNRMVHQTINQIYDFENNKIFLFSKEHTVLSKISIKMFQDNKILGVGPKNFRKVCFNDPKKFEFLKKYKPHHQCSTHPHNIFFQFLSETGLIGIIFYLIFLIGIFKIFINECFKKNKNIKTIFLLISLIISILPLVPSGQFFNNWLSVHLFLTIGFLINELKTSSQHDLKNIGK